MPRKSAQIAFFYVPVPNLATAKKMASATIKLRLAACANILPKINSIYEWNGKIIRENESVLILKTALRKKRQLMQYLAANHPYQTPAILVFLAQVTPPDFAKWVQNQTGRKR